jgi:hypothetical protein
MKIFKSLEKLFVAITFAEHGELDEARRVMAEDAQLECLKDTAKLEQKSSSAVEQQEISAEV